MFKQIIISRVNRLSFIYCIDPPGVATSIVTISTRRSDTSNIQGLMGCTYRAFSESNNDGNKQSGIIPHPRTPQKPDDVDRGDTTVLRGIPFVEMKLFCPLLTGSSSTQ